MTDPIKSYSIPNPLVYGIYTRLIDNIKHFGLLRFHYVKLAFTFFLAVFLGIGFILSGLEKLPFDKLIIIFFMTTSGVFGIILIAFLDFVVTDRLVQTTAIELVRMEKKYSWLPKEHHNMVAMKVEGMGESKSHFYLALSAILIFFSIISMYFILEVNHFYLGIAFIVFGIGLIFLLKSYLKKISKENFDFSIYVDL